MTASVLCIDDEPESRAVLEQGLARAGYRVVLASSLEEAMLALARGRIDLVIARYRPGGLPLPEEEVDRTPLILLTEDSSFELAVKTMGSKAIDYLSPPAHQVSPQGPILPSQRSSGWPSSVRWPPPVAIAPVPRACSASANACSATSSTPPEQRQETSRSYLQRHSGSPSRKHGPGPSFGE